MPILALLVMLVIAAFFVKNYPALDWERLLVSMLVFGLIFALVFFVTFRKIVVAILRIRNASAN